eukprot:SAG31_NODE_993_length_10512_cov_20.777202_1_plen_270_part_00
MRVLLAILATLPSARPALIVDLKAHADHSIRVRVAPAGGKIVDPPAMALLDEPPLLTTATHHEGANTLTNGNLKVAVDPATGCLTATRLSDGKVLLEQTALTFSAPFNHATKQVSISFLASISQITSEYLKTSQNISEHLRTSQNISEHLRTSQNISEYLKISQNISKHLRTSQNISKYLAAARGNQARVCIDRRKLQEHRHRENLRLGRAPHRHDSAEALQQNLRREPAVRQKSRVGRESLVAPTPRIAVAASPLGAQPYDKFKNVYA